MLGRRSVVVEAGEVWCPIRGATEVEDCLACPRLASVDRTPNGLMVACRGATHAVFVAESRVTFPCGELHPSR
jgi:hypothetical protein